MKKREIKRILNSGLYKNRMFETVNPIFVQVECRGKSLNGFELVENQFFAKYFYNGICTKIGY